MSDALSILLACLWFAGCLLTVGAVNRNAKQHLRDDNSAWLAGILWPIVLFVLIGYWLGGLFTKRG